MPDSNITKKALSAALIDLMKTMPFQKISVRDICEKCSMNRKSFYYHFKDKYDLVNWIFDNEFISIVQRKRESDPWEFLLEVLRCFYANRQFYQKALSYRGQNSLSDHIFEVSEPILRARMAEVLEGEEALTFYINFAADALLTSLMRWLREEDCMPPEQYLAMVKTIILRISNYYVNQELLENEGRQPKC
ncbi:MAG: TetR/AcrR family transcriptional regulator C-terminal domain-containing protein [Candidatus Faecivicinus sp.]